MNAKTTALDRIREIESVVVKLEARRDPEMMDEAKTLRFLLLAFQKMREIAIQERLQRMMYGQEPDLLPTSVKVDQEFEEAMASESPKP